MFKLLEKNTIRNKYEENFDLEVSSEKWIPILASSKLSLSKRPGILERE